MQTMYKYLITYEKMYTSLRLLCPKSEYLRIATTSVRFCSDNKKSEPPKVAEEVAKEKVLAKNTKSNPALEKLNTLLQKMVEEDVKEPKKPTLNLAKPRNRRGELSDKSKQKESKSSIQKEVLKPNVVKAVKDVAESMGGNTKQIESELLLKLLKTEEERTTPPASLSEIVKGMKIDRTPKPVQQVSESRSTQVKKILESAQSREQTQQTRFERKPRKAVGSISERVTRASPEKIDLFGGPALGIFDPNETYTNENVNKTWQKLNEREMKLAVTHPPENYFQEMILWTEQGKLWKFPIDNEQDIGEEKNVYFAEHVFLEKHLEPWCPSRGPIRHFMELVCVGLSKNPYITVEAKKEHIAWYKNYFENKIQLLKDVGAVSSEQQISPKTEQKIAEITAGENVKIVAPEQESTKP